MSRPEQTDVIRETNDGIVIALKVRPGARQAGFSGVHNHQLRVAVQAPPEHGRANRAVIRLLASTLSVASSQIEILRGTTSRSKQVRVQGVTLDDARAKLLK